MSTLAEFQISASAPSFVGGPGTETKFFKDNSYLEQLPYPFSGDGQSSLEIYATGVASSRGSVKYVIAAVTDVPAGRGQIPLADPSNIPGIATPFSLRLMLHADSACGMVQGTVASLLNGVSEPEKAITSFKVEKSNWSRSNHAPFNLVVGVAFAESAESNGAALFEFKIVSRGS